MGVLPPQRRRHSFSLAASVSLQRHIRLAEPAVTFDFCGSTSYFDECSTHCKVALQALPSCLDRLWFCSTCSRAGRFPLWALSNQRVSFGSAGLLPCCLAVPAPSVNLHG